MSFNWIVRTSPEFLKVFLEVFNVTHKHYHVVVRVQILPGRGVHGFDRHIADVLRVGCPMSKVSPARSLKTLPATFSEVSKLQGEVAHQVALCGVQFRAIDAVLLD